MFNLLLVEQAPCKFPVPALVLAPQGDVCALWQSFGLCYSLFQLQQKLLHE